MFATTDGGRTWFAEASNVDADLMDTKFIDAGTGWIVGTNGTLLHTIDGGVRWSMESSGTTHALERLFFTDRDHGWAVGFGGTILSYGQPNAPRLRS